MIPWEAFESTICFAPSQCIRVNKFLLSTDSCAACTTDQKTDHASPRHTSARRSILCRRYSHRLHVIRVIRKPRTSRWLRKRAAGNTDTHCLRASPRVNNYNCNAPIRILERRALKVRTTARPDSDSAGPDNAPLRKRPETLGDDVGLPVDEDKFLVVIVIRCAILDALPEQICAQVRIHNSVEHGIRPGIPIACATTLVPGGAPSTIQIRILCLPDARFRADWAANSGGVLVARYGINHAFNARGDHLASVLASDTPARGFAAVDSYMGKICRVEGGTEHLDEFGCLVSIGEHGGIRGGQVGLIEETKVRYTDAVLRIQLNVLDKIIGKCLFPVPAAAVGS